MDNLLNKTASWMGKWFKIFFTIFAGLMTFRQLLVADSAFGWFGMIVSISFYGFTCFVMWSGLCGGEKVSNVLILLTLGYVFVSEVNNPTYLDLYIGSEYWADNWSTYIMRILIGTASILCVSACALLILNVILKKDVFKIIAYVLVGVGIVLLVSSMAFEILRICEVGGKEYDSGITALVETLCRISGWTIVIAFFQNCATKTAD